MCTEGRIVNDLENKSKIMQSERMVNEKAISQMKPIKALFDWVCCTCGRKEFNFDMNPSRKVIIIS